MSIEGRRGSGDEAKTEDTREASSTTRTPPPLRLLPAEQEGREDKKDRREFASVTAVTADGQGFLGGPFCATPRSSG